ncbi:hypothetical protein D3C78_1879720 [compost metagenome]
MSFHFLPGNGADFIKELVNVSDWAIMLLHCLVNRFIELCEIGILVKGMVMLIVLAVLSIQS